MPKPAKTRLRTPYDSPAAHRPVEYETRDPDRRPPVPAEPRLGPYEFRYPVEFGYSAIRPIV